MRDSAYDAVEFVQRHVLRRGGGGDPRERAVQVVVRLLVGVQDTIRFRLLVERASQVFGLSEGVLVRAARLARGGQPSVAPIASAVRAQRKVEHDIERMALQALLHAGSLREQARERVSPEEFADPAARELAVAMWRGDDVAALEGAAGDLARELLAGAPEGFDWHAEADGALRAVKVRALERARREHRAALASARGEETNRLMAEIDRISKAILELKQ